MRRHIVQTPEWAQVKEAYGTPMVNEGGVYYSKHKIPILNMYYAYCPRVNPFEVNFDELKASLKKDKCIALTFDVPNVIKNTEEAEEAENLLKKHCRRSSRSEFAKGNVFIDLTKSEKELFENMHTKHRYNARYAHKKGVYVELAETQSDFDDFFNLFAQTAARQNYFIRPKRYYKTIWDILHPKGICYILSAKKDEEVLASWMLFVYDEVLYYPYGGSSTKMRNLQASNALGWEVIRFGKEKGCKLFDMWGAAENPEDDKDDYSGFTTFKLKYGGKHIRYIDSYDLPIRSLLYKIFTTANRLRWKFLHSGIMK